MEFHEIPWDFMGFHEAKKEAEWGLSLGSMDTGILAELSQFAHLKIAETCDFGDDSQQSIIIPVTNREVTFLILQILWSYPSQASKH